MISLLRIVNCFHKKHAVLNQTEFQNNTVMPPKRTRAARGEADTGNKETDAESKLTALLEELDVEGWSIPIFCVFLCNVCCQMTVDFNECFCSRVSVPDVAERRRKNGKLGSQ